MVSLRDVFEMHRTRPVGADDLGGPFGSITKRAAEVVGPYRVGAAKLKYIHEVDTFIVHCQLSIVHSITQLLRSHRLRGVWQRLRDRRRSR